MSQIQLEDLEDYLKNKQFILGCDEVGYGCCAGPLVVCGVLAPKNWNLTGLNDSKKLSPRKRETMSQKLWDLAGTISFHIAERSNEQIDSLGLGVALKDAYVEIFQRLHDDQALVICDGNLKFNNLNMDQVSLVKADGKIPAVMAASIIAKVYRDEKMKKLHEQYPNYNWISNVGYCTTDHLDSIRKYGFSPLHRMSYNLKSLSK